MTDPAIEVEAVGQRLRDFSQGMDAGYQAAASLSDYALMTLIDSVWAASRRSVYDAVLALHDATSSETSYGKGQRVAYRRVLELLDGDLR